VENVKTADLTSPMLKR